MSAVLLGTETPGSPAWHELRAGGIGASEIAAVVGLSPWVSAFQLWHIKAGNIAGQAESEAMGWGNRLEPAVRDWFQEQHPETAVLATPGTFAHSARSWQRVNPDGLIYPEPVIEMVGQFGERLGVLGRTSAQRVEPVALYEGKCSRYGNGFGKSGSDDIPIGYRCQIQQSLDIFDLPVAHLAVLIGGNEPREYVIHADPEDQRVLREAGQAFWDSLTTGDEPPLDCSDMTYEAVRELNPNIDHEAAVDLLPGLWAEYQHHKTAIAEHTTELTGVKSRILTAMGTARIARIAETPVLRREQRGNGNPYLKEVS